MRWKDDPARPVELVAPGVRSELPADPEAEAVHVRRAVGVVEVDPHHAVARVNREGVAEVIARADIEAVGKAVE